MNHCIRNNELIIAFACRNQYTGITPVNKKTWSDFMNLKIGAKIKALRKRDNVKQERLADALGVTSQAVSRWESENGYPDIEYITPIANFFNVTIDYLFDHDATEKKQKIQDYLTQFHMRQLDNSTQCHEQISLMRQALAEFPAEEILLWKLAEALHWQWINNGGRSIIIQDGYDVADVEKNKALDYWQEAVKISEELLTTSTDDSIRGPCREILAFIYGGIGEKEKLLAVAQKGGSIHDSKEGVLAHSSWGEDGIRYKQEFLLALLTPLQNTLRPLARLAGAEEETFAILFRLHELIFRDDCGIHNHWLNFLYSDYAGYLHGINKPDEAVKALEQAFFHAKIHAKFAESTNESTNNSPFTNLIKQQWGNTEPRSEVQRLLHTLKRYYDFQTLNANSGFVALVKEVEAWLAERG
jgi:transcriptional regulator with XRE-family HTH domain